MPTPMMSSGIRAYCRLAMRAARHKAGGAPPTLAPLCGLAKGHLLSHKQNNLAIFFAGFAQKSAKVAQKSRILARATPSNSVRLPLGQDGRFGQLVIVIEKPIHRNF